jgi:hypothetical protein
MNNIKTFLFTLCIGALSLFSAGCENTTVSGSMSYSTGMGYGYPMYYGPARYSHSSMIVVRPPMNRRRR